MNSVEALEIENAIKHHIEVNLEEDEEYYKKLSKHLEQIVEKHQEHWEEMVQLLLEFRDGIEANCKQEACDLGLSGTELAFHNILVAELVRITGNEFIDEPTHQVIKQVVMGLVDMLDDTTDIVEFFNKQDAIKKVKQIIKRRIVETWFDDPDLRKAVMDRFRELAEVKFGKKDRLAKPVKI